MRRAIALARHRAPKCCTRRVIFSAPWSTHKQTRSKESYFSLSYSSLCPPKESNLSLSCHFQNLSTDNSFSPTLTLYMDTLFFYKNAQLSKDLAKDSFYGHVTSRRRFTNVNYRQYPISPTFAITIANLVRSPDHCVSLRTKAGSTVRYDIFIVIRTGKKYRTVISYRTYEIVSNRTGQYDWISYRNIVPDIIHTSKITHILLEHWISCSETME